ncbi:autotransporter domain-containing protein [Salmonella enterica subsp. enterica serovar Paratyphi B]|nr:autotransporter outer membrane beta-barrel domain-containing protein [Salmonella enterica]ECO1613251.1 autotransporter outer membrane beta-barrel domain-containing protein [Salmonella enterica subsp. enterica serovar Paratyphi B]EGZ3914659.1 autotransporter outer membrane beta-barrel domain-containing protein [Salmonella enterica subsp. enterica serovar Java]EDD4441930.1 autotransporter domain-containing protein [Salmonella enterica subsp. enterica serovar Paratyphi B]MDJ7764401.1 autotransp
MSAGVTGNMQNQAERLGHILLDEPRGQGINNDEINMKVYYGHLKRRGMVAADTDSIGTVGYADYILSSDIMVGWHGGIEYAWLKAKSKTLQMNSTSGIMGLHGRYNITDRMYLRSQLSGILSRDHNYFSSFDGSHAKASVTNSGFYGASYLGYDFILNGKHVITPEVGFSTLLTHMPALSVNYDRNPDLSHRYLAHNNATSYANVSVRWDGLVDIGGSNYRPLIMTGVKKNVAGTDIKMTMTFNDQRFNGRLT